MKRINKSLWIIPILAGAILTKRLVARRQEEHGSKGGKTTKTKLEEDKLEKTLYKHHINDV